ncbi:hypothetical protein, partial [Streptomyces coeruleorubidus]|uniref:hypothetical protein n=1 Tax=Streptomyces coeruleorubidus TaxID=116188 RepID=UPI00340A6537
GLRRRRTGTVWLHRWENGAAGRAVPRAAQDPRAAQASSGIRACRSTRPGDHPAATIRLLAGRGAPAAHHRFPEQRIDTHFGRPGTMTDATARITVVTAMPTITARPFHDASRFVQRSQTATPL